MNWVQLGLFLERGLPKREKAKMVKKANLISNSKPIRRKIKPMGRKLAPGELDDSLDDLLGEQT